MKAALLLPTLSLGAYVAGCQLASEISAAGARPEPAPVIAASPVSSAPAADARLTAFLQERTRNATAPLGYIARSAGEGREALTLVYLVGQEYCGSGGCRLLILRASGNTWEVLGETSVSRPPIRLLSTQTNGLPDIGVRVSGGGVMEGYESALAFDGTRYPSNPTVAPARRVDNVDGVLVITGDESQTPLKP